jgi:glutaredoxin-dependent peroxiredoxin
LDLPKYESLDTQVLGVSVDHIGAQKAFAEKLGLTYPLLDDFSRETARKYGVLDEDPKSPYFYYARRSYFVIDKEGVVRYQHVMESNSHMLDPEEILAVVTKTVKSR